MLCSAFTLNDNELPHDGIADLIYRMTAVTQVLLDSFKSLTQDVLENETLNIPINGMTSD